MAEQITWDSVKATIQNGHIQWQWFFDERQLKEICLDRFYAEDAFGTSDHNLRLIYSMMADVLDAIQQGITFTEPDDKEPGKLQFMNPQDGEQ